MLKGSGVIGEGELWKSIKYPLNVYIEYIYSMDWTDHNNGLCVCNFLHGFKCETHSPITHHGLLF